MKARFFQVLILCLLLPLSAHAQQPAMYIDVAQKNIDVTTGFQGAELTVFGMLNEQGDVAILLKGPEKRVVLRRKQSVNGMWMNRASMDFRRVPLFYDYATSRDENLLANADVLREAQVGLNYILFDPDTRADAKTISEFQEALIRTQQQKGYFLLDPKQVQFTGTQLFRTNFYLPPSVPIGTYMIEAILFRDGAIISKQEIPIQVRPKGISALILMYATEYSLAYGLTALFIAVFMGLSGFFLLRRDRI
jgi:uncharacterized protein (TIGR02186 family)